MRTLPRQQYSCGPYNEHVAKSAVQLEELLKILPYNLSIPTVHFFFIQQLKMVTPELFSMLNKIIIIIFSLFNLIKNLGCV